MDRDSLILLLAQGLSVEEIGKRFEKHPSTVSYWMKKHGLEGPNREKHAAKGGIDRDRLTAMIDARLSAAEIAHELGLSVTTVRYWMRRYGLRSKHRLGPRHGALTREARRAGVAIITLDCPRHGTGEFVIEGRGYYRCKRCRADAVSRRRRKVKAILVSEAGGCCCICGYNRYMGALEFHHLDPEQKRLEMSRNGIALSIDALRAEARKCVLVCSNCHAEIEGGAAALPLKLPLVPQEPIHHDLG